MKNGFRFWAEYVNSNPINSKYGIGKKQKKTNAQTIKSHKYLFQTFSFSFNTCFFLCGL